MRRHKSAGRPKGSKNENWPEKLQSDKRYPLTVALNNAIQPVVVAPFSPKSKEGSERTATRGQTSHVRTQIVSPELCGMSTCSVLNE